MEQKRHTKNSLILLRGARCELCRCTRWKGKSIISGLVMARKDIHNKAYTDENAILVCRMCFYEHGLNRRIITKRRTKAEMEAARLQEGTAARLQEWIGEVLSPQQEQK
jgi:hypothetical protein